MRIFWLLWNTLAKLPFSWRLLIKGVIFGCVVLAALYPNPVLFFRQLHNYLDMESLIQPNFSGIKAINREIDTVLPPDATREHEFQLVQRYVYQHIPYIYDWDNWGNIDFWPPAGQVWERRKEDCDGRAVLAASILRSRGFDTAKLVGNIRHIWVAVDRYELMGPDKEQTIKHEGGKTRITLPSPNLLLSAVAIHIVDFPAIRNLIIFFTLMFLCYHPCRGFTKFFATTSMGLVGFILLRDWARELRGDDIVRINFELISGCSLICAAIMLALFMQTIVRRKRNA